MNKTLGGAVLNVRQNILPLKQPKKMPRNALREPLHVPSYQSVEQAVHVLRPSEPVQLMRPHVITSKAEWFLTNFPGDVLYAVKTNSEPYVLSLLYEAGVRHFDVASLTEVATVSRLFPDAKLHYMHTVKSRESIAEAYFKHGVRHFSLDTHEELQKILEETLHASDLELSVRLSIVNDKAMYALAGKFGVKLEEAGSLMLATRKAAAKFGICFHVGSQCMDPESYATTIGYVHDLLQQVDVRLDILDIGGGFPSVYPHMTPPPLANYMTAIKEALSKLPLAPDCRILCEPGRALVAEGGSILVRVDLRKGNMLYINDGAFGSLFDAAHTEFDFPAKAIRYGGGLSEESAPFGLFGPTCDSMDVMHGPFMLPANINEGDWIEIGQLGAYGASMRTRFNGFYSDAMIALSDAPILSMDNE